jgi:hypothetical protein
MSRSTRPRPGRHATRGRLPALAARTAAPVGCDASGHQLRFVDCLVTGLVDQTTGRYPLVVAMACARCRDAFELFGTYDPACRRWHGERVGHHFAGGAYVEVAV